jgi:hypothetical protein
VCVVVDVVGVGEEGKEGRKIKRGKKVVKKETKNRHTNPPENRKTHMD